MFQTPVQHAPEPTEPVTLARDPQPLKIVNVIRYHEADQGHNLDQYSDNITDGDVAIDQFKLAVANKMFAGKQIRACALIVGGFGQGNSVHGGEQVAAWSIEGGASLPEGWEDKVLNRKRPTVVLGERALSPATNDGSDPGDEQAAANAPATTMIEGSDPNDEHAGE